MTTKILVVDDDPFVRDVLTMILEAGGFEVDVAGDGAAALARHGANPADLIISDMNMPAMDGLELIKRVRSRDDDVPIIILTANNQISYAIDAIRSGANDYVLKDENIQDTVSLSVESVLEKHNLRRQNLQLMTDLRVRNERMEKERILAQNVQRNILPKRLDFEDLDICTFYQPSDRIGGDFFDAWESKGLVHFLVGDVSGHSISAALIMAVAKGVLQTIGHTMSDPVAIVTAANRMLCDTVSDSAMFLTLVYGIVDRAANEIRMVSAGHNPVLVIDGAGAREIPSTGPVLGWDAADTWEPITCPFPPGASLFLYTDGLTEARNAAGDEFGEARLCGLLDGLSPAEMVGHTFGEVSEFCGRQFADDLTIFVIKRIATGG